MVAAVGDGAVVPAVRAAVEVALGLGVADEINRGHMVLLHAHFFSFSL